MKPDGTTLGDHTHLATYSSVTQIGLTAGSATITGAWAALPNNSILLALAADFSSSELPSVYGTVELVKWGPTRGWVMFHTVDGADFKMPLDTANATVTGTWERANVKTQTYTLTASGGTLDSSISGISRSGNTVVCWGLFTPTTAIAGGAWKAIASFPTAIAPPKTLSTVGMSAYTAVQIQVTSAGVINVRAQNQIATGNANSIRWQITWLID